MSAGGRTIFILTMLLLAPVAATAMPAGDDPLVVRPDEITSDIIVRGRQVRVLGQVNGSILILGSDAIIEGRVEGSVNAIGGSIIQRSGGFIGGDVIVVGGDYQQSTDAQPLNPNAQKVVIREYSQYFRESFQHPWRRLLIPEVTPLYLGQRVLGILFYFLIALVIIALLPSQLHRAMDTLTREFRQVALIGAVTFLLLLTTLFLVVRSVPIEVAASITLFATLLLLAAYMFGSLGIYLIVGRWIQTRFRLGRHRSNLLALLYAIAAFALIFSVPIIGLLANVVLIVLSLGISLALPLARASRPVPALSD